MIKKAMIMIVIQVIILTFTYILLENFMDTQHKITKPPHTTKRVDNPADDIDIMIEAIRIVEGWHGEDGLFGEVGPLQITPDYLADYNNANRSNQCTIEQMNDLGPAWRVTRWYLQHYSDSVMEMPGIHNSGPSGPRLQSQFDYEQRAINIYKQLKAGKINPSWNIRDNDLNKCKSGTSVPRI